MFVVGNETGVKACVFGRLVTSPYSQAVTYFPLLKILSGDAPKGYLFKKENNEWLLKAKTPKTFYDFILVVFKKDIPKEIDFQRKDGFYGKIIISNFKKIDKFPAFKKRCVR